MNTIVEENNVTFDHLLTQGVDDHCTLEDRIKLNMILARRDLFKSKVDDEYTCIAVGVKKKDGTLEVANLSLLTEIFLMEPQRDFIDEVVSPQGKKLPIYIERQLKLTMNDIDSVDIKIFTYTKDEMKSAIEKVFGKKTPWDELIAVVRHAWEYGIHSNDMTLGEIEEDISCALNRFAKAMNLPQVNWEEENDVN